MTTPFTRMLDEESQAFFLNLALAQQAVASAQLTIRGMIIPMLTALERRFKGKIVGGLWDSQKRTWECGVLCEEIRYEFLPAEIDVDPTNEDEAYHSIEFFACGRLISNSDRVVKETGVFTVSRTLFGINGEVLHFTSLEDHEARTLQQQKDMAKQAKA